MKRIMAFDIGSHTLGLAQSDLLGLMAHPVKTFCYEECDWDKALNDIFSIINLNEFSQIIIGLPKTLKNKQSESTLRAIRFREFLQAYINDNNLNQSLIIKMWDERFTTNTANNLLKNSTVHKKNKKKVVDTIAAVIILDNYLQFIK